MLEFGLYQKCVSIYLAHFVAQQSESAIALLGRRAIALTMQQIKKLEIDYLLSAVFWFG